MFEEMSELELREFEAQQEVIFEKYRRLVELQESEENDDE